MKYVVFLTLNTCMACLAIHVLIERITHTIFPLYNSTKTNDETLSSALLLQEQQPSSIYT